MIQYIITELLGVYRSTNNDHQGIVATACCGGVIIWIVTIAFRWTKSRPWNKVLTRMDGGIQLTSDSGGITLTRNSEQKFIDIENPLQGFIHNEVETDSKTNRYAIGEINGDLIITQKERDGTE